jgi:hypothetical protein
MESTKKDQLLRYYENTRQHLTEYHNYKEKSVWAGVVLFAAFCSGVFHYKPPSDGPTAVYQCGLATVTLLATLFALFYVWNQLNLKDKAAAYLVGAFRLISEVAQNDEAALDLEDYLKISPNLNNVTDFSLSLPGRLQSEAEEFKNQGGHAKKKTRYVVCALIVLFGLSAVGSRLLPML